MVLQRICNPLTLVRFQYLAHMKCIEIDGDHHMQFEEIIERDKRKDKYLQEIGWNILRINWKDMYMNPKKYIELAKEFIDN
jgi:very-short-patch-repair endonuclease